MRKLLLITLFILLEISEMNAQVVTTIAGSAGVVGTTNGIGNLVRFNNPHGITSDKSGNIYITDRYNNLIRKITTSGIVSTLAGTGAVGSTDGAGNVATFNEPWGITCDTLGNIFVADTKNYKIRKIDATGNVTTIAGTGIFGTTNGANNVAKFGFSSGITVTEDGSIIYVADYNTHVIRKIFNGQVTTFAGTIYIAGALDGLGLAATFNHPYGIELDNNGNIIVGDEWNNIIRKITPAGMVSTFAGQGIIGSINGTALTSQFNYPWDIAVDGMNNIYVLDGFNFTVRKIANNGVVSTYVGTPLLSGAVDGVGAAARFNNAAGITYNRFDRCLYVADCNNHLIRKITSQSLISIVLTANVSATVCAGDSVHLNASPNNLTNYTIKEGSSILGSSINGIISIAPLPSGTHNLICTAFDSNGATASSNIISITVLPTFIPTLTSSNGTTICQGDSVKLSTQTGNSYAWSNGNTTSNIYVSSAGTYSVTVTNSNGCKGQSSSIIITLQTKPAATISTTSNSVCPNDSIMLTASLGTSWKWSNGSTSQSITIPAGVYSVTVTNSFGCSAVSTPTTINNYIITIPNINPAGIVTIIQSDSVLLTASGGNNYLWSNSLNGNAIYIKSSGNYFVNATSSNGCVTKSNVVQVIVITSSSIISANGLTSFCEGNNVVLSSIFPTGNQWFYNGLAINGATGQQFVAIDSGYYKVGIAQNNGTVYSDSVLVNVLPSPPIVSISDSSVCVGSVVDLQLRHQIGINYSWYSTATGGTSILVSDNFQTQPITTTKTYFIESIGSNGCTSTQRATVTITALPTPISDFSQVISPLVGQFPTSFTNATINANVYTWIFGDTTIAGNSSTAINPTYTYSSIGNYKVILIAENYNGCRDSLARTISIHNNNSLFIPTTFTPNGDGKNDIFRVRGDQFTFQQMKIYDQWGTLIYQTDASRPDWDGKVNGENVQNGTYVYHIQIIDNANISEELRGSVTVIK